MAIGERIKFIRNLRGMTQKYLGIAIGFDEKTADIRMAQYESGTRTPKEKLVTGLANALEVSPKALDVPDIDSHIGLMHTLFAIEDLYGFKINSIDGELCLTLDKTNGSTYLSMFDMFNAWQHEAEKLKAGTITKEEYDHWRYNYPRIEAERLKAELDARRAEKNAEPTENQKHDKIELTDT
jgi:transcriptional regulator with XRE-family HTH domain